MRQTNYEEIAASYDQRYIEEDYSGIERALFEFANDSGQRVVEVGCGTAHWIELLGARGFSAVGIDPSSQMLSVARRKLPSTPFIRARAEDLPFLPATFDRLFAINAHHHFTDKRRFLAEALGILRPGGSVMTIALDPHTGSDRWWVYDYFEGTLQIDQERYPACAQLRDWMHEMGFEQVYTREVMHLPGNVLAAEALARGTVTPSHTSQLAVLTRAEYEAGVERIRAAIRNYAALRLYSDLRVYATYATAPY